MASAVLLPSVQDRTQEFRACVTSIAKINGTVVGRPGSSSSGQTGSYGGSGIINGPESAFGGPGASSGSGTGLENKSPKSQFALRASGIAQEISETTAMLQRLALLAKRKTLFDDRPVEIGELSFVIKQKLSKINDSIASLQAFVKTQGGGKAASAWGTNKSETQLNEHSRNVVVLLQGKLTDVTTGFTEVLETRTKNTQATRSRTEQFISSASSSVRDHTSSESPLYAAAANRRGNSSPAGSAATGGAGGDESYGENPYGRPLSSSTAQSLLPDHDKPGSGQDDFLVLPQQEQTMALLEEQQDSYLSQRSSAVEAIESTIQELGGIFSQLATMVAEQRETVQRIDANTEDIALNVSGAQRELLKYYSRISSNRWLMVKMFGIIIVSYTGATASGGWGSAPDPVAPLAALESARLLTAVTSSSSSSGSSSRRLPHSLTNSIPLTLVGPLVPPAAGAPPQTLVAPASQEFVPGPSTQRLERSERSNQGLGRSPSRRRQSVRQNYFMYSYIECSGPGG
ncbi:Sed5p [Sugiyamaella lignohabitans]|uniref:Sed5p n=1 Tax=Sugiyamaella lignohabitans TaxID=796027 RepID=A0A167E8X5_9ASCO|nr:Sed5p [Sugiyamaella lignohabitans]ANB13786.1 Sed5p [Sugiyamaella lignohabitans]